MNRNHTPIIIAFGTGLAFLLLFAGCRGGGIFAYVATTEVIDQGSLSKGLQAGKMLEISNEYADTHYNYFSAGPAFYRRNTAIRSENTEKPWEKLTLPSGWTNIQSITASDDRILLGLVKESSGSPKIGLYYYNNKNGFKQVDISAVISTDSDKHDGIRLFCLNPDADTDTFYINVLEYSGDFDQKSTFNGSSLYLLDDGTETVAIEDAAPEAWKNLLQTESTSYISSAARGHVGNDAIYRFTTYNPEKETGQLFDENGQTITVKDGGIVARSLTWLPEKSVFIMSGWKLDGSTYPLYISKDGTTWSTLTTSYRYASFLDITGTVAGSDPDEIVLAGTRNFKNTTTGSGYLEIVANEADPADWEIRTSKNSFAFAQIGTYNSSELSNDSILWLSLLEGYVYASTDDDAIWRIYAGIKEEDERDDLDLKWARE